MAYTQHKIGSYQFITLQGQPQAFQELVELLNRPGVDGTRKRLMGLKASPFKMRSVATAADMPAGRQLSWDYHALPTLEPVQFIWEDIDFDPVGLRVRVLHVRQLRLAVMACMTGNVGGGHTAILEAEWDLQFVPHDPGIAWNDGDGPVWNDGDEMEWNA